MEVLFPVIVNLKYIDCTQHDAKLEFNFSRNSRISIQKEIHHMQVWEINCPSTWDPKIKFIIKYIDTHVFKADV